VRGGEVRSGEVRGGEVRSGEVPGGEVIVVGTTDWVFGLADDPAVSQVTKNILDRHLT